MPTDTPMSSTEFNFGSDLLAGASWRRTLHGRLTDPSSPAWSRTRNSSALATQQRAAPSPVQRRVGRRADVLSGDAVYADLMMLTPGAADSFEATELRKHAEGHANDDVIVLRAHIASEECGLVVLDLDSGDADEAILVEIFVIAERRSTGLGSLMLSCAEAYARSSGRSRMSLDAEPLDSDPGDDDAKESLIRWYKGRGYSGVRGQYDQLEKQL